MSDDLQEFLDLTPTESTEPSRLMKNHQGEFHAAAPEAPETKEKQSVGQLCQYAHNGSGFVPTTKTLGKLDPGIYRIDFINQIWTFNPQKLYTDDLLIFPDSVTDSVVNEIERFWKLKSKFKEMGLTHKRGFLIWGPPGGGKTGTVSLIAKKTVKAGNIVLFSTCHPKTVSMMLANAREVEPNRPIVVIMEDIDTIIQNYGEADVLALLDGEASIDNVLFLATTNYPENLDGRVSNRPSRFDKILKIGMPSAASRKIYLESRKLGLTPEEMEEWVFKTDNFSIAQLKEVVISVKIFENGLDETIDRLLKMSKKVASSDGKSGVGFKAEKEVISYGGQVQKSKVGFGS